jgi:hypothetical protein
MVLTRLLKLLQLVMYIVQKFLKQAFGVVLQVFSTNLNTTRGSKKCATLQKTDLTTS